MCLLLYVMNMQCHVSMTIYYEYYAWFLLIKQSMAQQCCQLFLQCHYLVDEIFKSALADLNISSTKKLVL